MSNPARRLWQTDTCFSKNIPPDATTTASTCDVRSRGACRLVEGRDPQTFARTGLSNCTQTGTNKVSRTFMCGSVSSFCRVQARDTFNIWTSEGRRLQDIVSGGGKRGVQGIYRSRYRAFPDDIRTEGMTAEQYANSRASRPVVGGVGSAIGGFGFRVELPWRRFGVPAP